jgi:ABC-2 type transport system permease protein
MDAAAIWETAVAQLPAALIYLAVPALVFVLWPAGTIAVGWLLLGLGVVLGIFGGMVGLDQNIRDLSPFSHAPVPNGATDWSGAWWMLAIAVAAGAVAVAVMRRREVGAA